MAKILQFPNGAILKGLRKSRPSGLDLIRYFEDPSVKFDTLALMYKLISTRYRRRQKAERDREWSS